MILMGMKVYPSGIIVIRVCNVCTYIYSMYIVYIMIIILTGSFNGIYLHQHDMGMA